MGLTEPVWRKSSRSGGENACVEAAVIRNFQRSAPGNTDTGYCFVLRDSKDPDGPRLYFTSRGWETFRRDLENGMFDDLALDRWRGKPLAQGAGVDARKELGRWT